MKIIIEYESCWRNSFLDGSNNAPLPKNGRNFIGSITNLKKPENFIQREVTLDTVMGILNRLIGDQRKLYQARGEENYFFKNLESKINFIDKPKATSKEMTYIRNITGSTDQNSYTGMIKTREPIFLSDYSADFWGILAFELEELCDFIDMNNSEIPSINLDPRSIISRLEEINKLKPIENTGKVNAAFLVLQNKFEKFQGLTKGGQITPISLYCSALYLQLDRLSKKYDMATAKTKAGGISGVSNNGFTKKDFMSRFTTGEKKKIWGNPYNHEVFIKGEGKIKNLMTKASGILEIEIPVSEEQGKKLQIMIENAGVSSFYLGKKGLAYVSKIRI